MKIHIVSKVVDSLQNPETTLVGAYVDKDRADAKAQEIAGRKTITSLGDLQSLTYGVVESVELDLTGMNQTALDELREVVG